MTASYSHFETCGICHAAVCKHTTLRLPEIKMTIVPRLRTPMTRVTMRRALVDGHVAALGVAPSVERVAVALAMLCEEHANGEAIWNFDLGNRDAGPGWEGDTFELTAREVLGGKSVQCTKLLRAYPDAACGARGFWDLLSAPRFAHTLVAFDMGDPSLAALCLKMGGWYTGSEADYARAMVALYPACLALASVVDEAP